MITNLKKLTLGLSAAALTIGGVACAQAPANPPKMERPKIDADGDGIVTRAEAQAAATAMFAKLDVNKDGKLDKADRELARQQMRDAKFAKLDANNDGAISKAEFSADRGPQGGPDGGPDGPPPPGGPRGEGPGKDGREGRSGWGQPGHHGFGKGGHGPRGGMMAMARQADTNNDGAISQAEFMAAATKRFDAEDANKDGKVTQAERQAAREAKKAEWQQKRADKKADKKASN
ncbi:MAG TPA: EF-hand domain-containing protein [Novosphingobium sp.]|nr:EF-hand domain-containing protein [Novosphingobium sp.]